MRHITDDGLEIIMHHEGFVPEVYNCPAGIPTIGYGHVVLKGESFDNGISKEQGMEILRKDVEIAERAVLRLCSVPLEDEQFDALVSWTFNLGSGTLQRSTLRQCVLREDHEEVPRQMKRWVYSGGKKLKGLIRRRDDEAQLYASADF
jgi:lysozyme